MYIEDQTFEKKDYTLHFLEEWEYEKCKFSQCNFSGSDLSRRRFIDCEFIECNLSVARLTEASIQNVHFLDSKLIGLEFQNCNEFLFGASFENCNLEFASFTNMKIKWMNFHNCNLHEANFSGSDLTWAKFDICNLDNAVFQRTNLEKVDFLTSYGYSIDPENNRMKGSKFSLEWIPGLLHKYNIIIK